MKGFLAARGRHALPRRVGRRGGLRVRRGRLHDGDDRLPGGRHRPELRGSDRLLHGGDGRQLRRRADHSESGAAHARAVVMREARGPAWTDWLYERGVVALSGIDTRSLVLHLRQAGSMRAIALAGEASVDEALRERPGPAEDGRARARGEGLDARAVRLLRRGPGADRGRRLRLQALDPEPPRVGRRRGHRLSPRRRRRRAGALRRRPPLERPRRPGAPRRRSK